MLPTTYFKGPCQLGRRQSQRIGVARVAYAAAVRGSLPPWVGKVSVSEMFQDFSPEFQ